MSRKGQKPTLRRPDADRKGGGLDMDPVNPVRLSRIYEDVDWVEKLRRTRRGKKKQDEYRPSKQPREGATDEESGQDTFEPSEPQK